MLDILNQSFYQIKDKKPLLVEYQRLFNIALCDTCTSSYIKAYNELKTFYKNEEIMAKSTPKNIEETPAKKYVLKPEYAGSKTSVSGLTFQVDSDTPDEIIEANIELIGFLFDQVK